MNFVAYAQTAAQEPLSTFNLILFGFIFLLLLYLLRPRKRKRQSERYREPTFKSHVGSVIRGKAYVTDGDGVRVAGHEIRIAGIDAPEFDQIAKNAGKWFNHGRVVKSALIKKIGGKEVVVNVVDSDQFGRLIGVVRCDMLDVGGTLVSEGHAVAAYNDSYANEERLARQNRRGMWGYEESFDPRWWRHKHK